MVKYLSEEFMLDTLKKVQPYQIDIFKSGRHCHVDGGVYVGFGSGSHVNFDVTVFEDSEIVRQFEFAANMTEKEIEAELMSLEAYVDRIKED